MRLAGIKKEYLLTVATLGIGFLLVVLIRSNIVAGALTVNTEAAVPSLVQTNLENEQLVTDNEKLRQELAKYVSGQNASNITVEQLRQARLNAGLVPVSGPGIRITLDDSKRPAVGEDAANYVIHEQYLRDLINILWNGGAEAIAVNGQRFTSNTEIFCSGSFIQINGTRQMPPYVIEAVGDTHSLQAALKFYVWDKLGDFEQQYGITRRLEVVPKVNIPAGKLREYKFAEPVKEGSQ